MKELWKKIDWITNLRGEYEISNLGNVRRTSLLWHNHLTGECQIIHKIRNLLLYDNGHGYLYVSLPIDTENGIRKKMIYVHKLVAICFLKNPDNKTEINHKNFNRKDNRVSNLEWCTHEENSDYSKTMDNRLKPYYPSKGSKRNQNEFKARIEKNSSYIQKFYTSKKPIEKRNIHYFQGKYTVRVGYNKKKIYLGRFEKYEDAVNARISKLKELHLLE